MSAHPDALAFIAARLESRIRPKKFLPFEAWIEQEIILVDGPHAGEPFRFATQPALRGIAECLNEDHPANEVSVRKCQQSSVTTLAEAWSLYIADRMPANTLYGLPGLDALRDLNSTKLQPLVDAWEKHANRVVIHPQTSRSGVGSTTYEKKFAGGYLSLANANAVMDLSMKTTRFGIKDEVSKWEDIPGYGDPEKLFFGRFTSFRRYRNWKIFQFSTPEVDTGADDPSDAPGHCRIDRHFRLSDRRYFNVRCPECGQRFVHDRDRLIIDLKHPHKSVYQHECGHHITDSERVPAVRDGTWIPTADVPHHAGFHYDAFVSLNMSYEAIAEDTLKAKSETDRKSLANLVHALPYKFKGDAPEWEKLQSRVEPYLKRGHVPPKGLLLVGFADVQMRGLWLNIVAFAPNGESWDVDALYIDGDTSKVDGPAFQQLRKETIDREFPDPWGRGRKLDALGVDSGYRAHIVYAWVRRHQQVHPISGRDIILATKGLEGWGRPAIGQPSLVDIDLDGKKIRQGAKVWGIGTWSLKASLYSNLRQTIPEPPLEPIAPDGYCHFGTWNDEVYFKQLTAEQLEDVKHRGRVTHQKWVRLRENHFHDCRVGALALADYLGLNSTTPEQWASLAQARLLPPELATVDLFTPRGSAPVVAPKDAARAEQARKDAERETARDVSPDAVSFLEGYTVKF